MCVCVCAPYACVGGQLQRVQAVDLFTSDVEKSIAAINSTVLSLDGKIKEVKVQATASKDPRKKESIYWLAMDQRVSIVVLCVGSVHG